MRTTGQIIKRHLANIGMTQRQLAHKLGISDAYLSAMLLGNNKIPTKYLRVFLEHLKLEPREQAELFQAHVLANRPIPWGLFPEEVQEELAAKLGTAMVIAWWSRPKESEDGQD